jgi:hypothetical protein
MCFKPCLHFVGFRDDAYNRAVRVFGKPDFVHRFLDRRAMDDFAPGDTVVFGRAKDWDRLVASWHVPTATLWDQMMTAAGLPTQPVNRKQYSVLPPFSFNDSEHF